MWNRTFMNVVGSARRSWLADETLFRLAAIGFPAFVFGYWLLAENHGIFGDEGWHLVFLLDAWKKPASTALQRVWDLYVFNDQYPPLFYLLSAPFVFFFDNHLVGARLFVATLGAAVLWLFYRCLRLFIGRWSSLVGVYVLLTSGIFIEATRYYLLEILLALFVLATWFLVVSYRRNHRPELLVAIGLTLAAGLLTKLNFPIYVLPMGVVLGAELLRREAGGRIPWGSAARRALLVAAPLLLAVPWYWQNLANPRNILVQYRVLRDLGDVTSIMDPVVMLTSTWRILPEFFPGFVYAGLVVCAVVYLVGRRAADGAHDADATRRVDHALLFSGAYVLYLTFVLFPLGLSYAQRWNLSYLFVAAALALMLSAVRPPWLKRSFGAILAMLAVLWCTNNLVRHFTDWPVVNYPQRQHYSLPDALPTGMAGVASLVVRNERSLPAPSEHATVSLLSNQHDAANASALNYELKLRGSTLKAVPVGGFDNAVDVDMLLDVNYIVRFADRRMGVDPEVQRYVAIADRWLGKYPQTFRLIGRAETRRGDIEVWWRPNGNVPFREALDLVDTGRALGKGTPFEPFWDLALYRLQFSRGSGQEVDESFRTLAAHLPEFRAKLRPVIGARLEREVGEVAALQKGAKSIVREPLTERVASGGALAFVDSIKETTSCFFASGWVGRADKAGPMKEALLVQSETILARLSEFSARPDVAEAFKAPGMRGSGFMFCIPYSHMQSGPTPLRLLARDNDGTLHEFYRKDINLAATRVSGSDDPQITKANTP